jgi:uncharacterized UBP type Zn finger protein
VLDCSEIGEEISVHDGKYDLKAVVFHSGDDALSGHYIVHCIDDDGVWRRKYDRIVSVISEADASRSFTTVFGTFQTYGFFYTRANL